MILEQQFATGLSTVTAQEAAGGVQIPGDIQWMPPGRHEIHPTIDGKPASVTIDVNAALADRLAVEFERMLAEHADGSGDLPFLDFAHKREAASGHVTAMYWGGNDSKTGGIRIKVDWTTAGRTALADRQYRRFSPSWLINAQTGEVQGLAPNLGGLVNHAAFSRIQSVRAGHGGTRTHHIQMTQQEITTAVATAVAEAMKPLNDQLNAIRTTAATAAAAAAPAAVPPELQQRISTLEAQAAGQVRQHATRVVQAAQSAGRLAPQDAASEAFWVDAIVAQGAKAETALASLSINPAFVRVVQAGANGGAAGAGMAGGTPAVTNTADGFVATFRVEAAKAEATKTGALTAAISANPEGYKAWRAANGQPGL